MIEVCVTKDLPYHRQIVECYGFRMLTKTKFTDYPETKKIETIDGKRAWYIAEFLITHKIEKTKYYRPIDPKDFPIEEYFQKEIWIPPGRLDFNEQISYVGVTKWKEIDFDLLKLR